MPSSARMDPLSRVVLNLVKTSQVDQLDKATTDVIATCVQGLHPAHAAEFWRDALRCDGFNGSELARRGAAWPDENVRRAVWDAVALGWDQARTALTAEPAFLVRATIVRRYNVPADLAEQALAGMSPDDAREFLSSDDLDVHGRVEAFPTQVWVDVLKRLSAAQMRPNRWTNIAASVLEQLPQVARRVCADPDIDIRWRVRGLSHMTVGPDVVVETLNEMLSPPVRSKMSRTQQDRALASAMDRKDLTAAEIETLKNVAMTAVMAGEKRRTIIDNLCARSATYVAKESLEDRLAACGNEADLLALVDSLDPNVAAKVATQVQVTESEHLTMAVIRALAAKTGLDPLDLAAHASRGAVLWSDLDAALKVLDRGASATVSRVLERMRAGDTAERFGASVADGTLVLSDRVWRLPLWWPADTEGVARRVPLRLVMDGSVRSAQVVSSILRLLTTVIGTVEGRALFATFDAEAGNQTLGDVLDAYTAAVS